jgi:hypothetical protein
MLVRPDDAVDLAAVVKLTTQAFKSTLSRHRFAPIGKAHSGVALGPAGEGPGGGRRDERVQIGRILLPLCRPRASTSAADEFAHWRPLKNESAHT